jgi:hypothetical protein
MTQRRVGITLHDPMSSLHLKGTCAHPRRLNKLGASCLQRSQLYAKRMAGING